MNRLLSMLGGCAMFFGVGPAMAGEPLVLTDAQLENVTAGVTIVSTAISGGVSGGTLISVTQSGQLAVADADNDFGLALAGNTSAAADALSGVPASAFSASNASVVRTP